MSVPVGPLGPGLALCTAFLWGLSPVCMASAARKIGSYPVLLLRLALASAALVATAGIYSLVAGVHLTLPNTRQTLWMVVSGVAAMGAGDACIYEALVLVGAQRTTQVLLIAPIFSALIAWLWQGELMGPKALCGAAIVLAATAYAVFARGQTTDPDPAGRPHAVPLGVGLSAVGALFAAIGAVTGRVAFQAGPPVDPIVMAPIRVMSAGAMFWGLALLRRDSIQTLAQLKDRFILNRLLVGMTAGPFVGILCYVAALKHAPAGLVSTLTATSPLFVLPMLAIRRRRPIRRDIALATVVAITGVALICLPGG